MSVVLSSWNEICAFWRHQRRANIYANRSRDLSGRFPPYFTLRASENQVVFTTVSLFKKGGK